MVISFTLTTHAGSLSALGLSDFDNVIRLLNHTREIHNRTGNHDRDFFLTGPRSVLPLINRPQTYLPVGVHFNSFSSTRSMKEYRLSRPQAGHSVKSSFRDYFL